MNYIIIFKEVKHLLKFLNEKERSLLWDILFNYSEGLEISFDSGNLENVFNILKPKLDDHIARSKLKSDISRSNGSKGGRPKINKRNPRKPNNNPAKPTGFSDIVDGLKFVLESKMNKSINASQWHIPIRKLIELDLKSRISPENDVKAAIQAISDHYGEVYFPVVQSANSFREKFTKIEAFLRRINHKPEPLKSAFEKFINQ